LIIDYAILAELLAIFVVVVIRGNDATNFAIVLCAWIAQVGISTAAYYWKAKSENLVKLPLLLLAKLPEDMREKADPNQIISSVLGIGNN
jgi:hypothetical protein